MTHRALVNIPHADAGLPGPGVVAQHERFTPGQAAKGARLVRLGAAVRIDGADGPPPAAPPVYTVTPSGGGWFAVETASPDGRGVISESMQGRTVVRDFIARTGGRAVTPDGAPFTLDS